MFCSLTNLMMIVVAGFQDGEPRGDVPVPVRGATGRRERSRRLTQPAFAQGPGLRVHTH